MAISELTRHSILLSSTLILSQALFFGARDAIADVQGQLPYAITFFNLYVLFGLIGHFFNYQFGNAPLWMVLVKLVFNGFLGSCAAVVVKCGIVQAYQYVFSSYGLILVPMQVFCFIAAKLILAEIYASYPRVFPDYDDE